MYIVFNSYYIMFGIACYFTLCSYMRHIILSCVITYYMTLYFHILLD